MINLILVATLSCPAPTIQNVSGFPWNNFDQLTLDRAKTRCGVIYKTSPCVKLFRKYKRVDYSVVCGPMVTLK